MPETYNSDHLAKNIGYALQIEFILVQNQTKKIILLKVAHPYSMQGNENK